MESRDPRWVRNRFAVALASVFHFWDRYFVGFVPLLVVWTANGIDVMVEAVQNRSAARWLGFVPTALVAVFLLTLLFSTKVRFLDDSSTTIEQQGGLWLAEHGGRAQTSLVSAIRPSFMRVASGRCCRTRPTKAQRSDTFKKNTRLHRSR
jgi:hypothetical protein